MTLAPPSAEEKALALSAAPPVEMRKDETAVDELPDVSSEMQLQIRKNVGSYIQDLNKLTPRSPEFNAKVAEIATLGSQEIVKSSDVTARLLASPSSSLAGAKRSGSSSQVKVASTLSELRNTIDDLSPNNAGVSKTKKILGIFPGGKSLSRYFQRYESAQTQLDAIVKSLNAGQDELRKDNASLTVEREHLWDTLGTLKEYALMANELKEVVLEEVHKRKNSGDTTGATALESDVLFSITQRHQDILTQIAVSIQGYLAMDLIQKNNLELIKGVDRARTTTLSALRTAVIVAQALENQRLVLDQIEGINATTSSMIASTSAMLRENTTMIHNQAASSGVSVETLQKAFDDVFATMDAIDTFKIEANQSMQQTIGALSGQIERTRPYLERSRGAGTQIQSAPSTLQLTHSKI